MFRRPMTVAQRLVGAMALLALLNALAHFVPPERAGHEPDDAVYVAMAGGRPYGDLAATAVQDPSRPITWLFWLGLARAFGFEPAPQLILLMLVTTVLSWAVLALARLFLPETEALLVAAVYVVLPMKHEAYGTLLYAPVDLAAALYLGSAIAYVRFARSGSASWLTASALAYGLAMMGYELGAFAPLLLLALARIPAASRRKAALAFGIVIATIAARRLLVDSALGPLPARHPVFSSVALLRNLVTTLPSWLMGPHALRTIGYGLQGFFSLPTMWMSVALLSLAAFFEWLRRELPAVAPLPRRAAVAALLAAVVLTLPAALILVESRHTMIALAPLAAVALEILRRISLRSPAFAASCGALLLMSSQGLALRQAEHGRITWAMREAVGQVAPGLTQGRRLVYDLDSFARAIPHAWGRPGHDTFRAYWGMHTFSVVGLRRLATLSGMDAASPTPLVCATPLRHDGDEIVCDRHLQMSAPFRVPAQDAVILDYSAVCGAPAARCPR